MKYITNSGITNLKPNLLKESYKQCDIFRVGQGKTSSTMQMIIILYLLKCLDSKKVLILDTGRASNPCLNSEPKKSNKKKV
jgi:hypothetical protein